MSPLTALDAIIATETTIETEPTFETSGFDNLGLPAHILRTVKALGYVIPTPIQAEAIPVLLRGSDIVGQAQTGTGKTAAFALPTLCKVKVENHYPQVLVLAPTRELAIQVATAFTNYATAIPGIKVLPIYGGQAYAQQLSVLKQGAHIIVGTPGRIMDHIDRKTLNLSKVHTMILDEADEMLKMGFIDDVETIIKQLPAKRQVALFSATMPMAIRNIADRYLTKPQKITITTQFAEASNIKQCYWEVKSVHKVDALSRILEAEEINAMLVFVKTKRGTEELAEQLAQRGFSVVALNGDIAQQQRERIIKLLKGNKVNIVVATDVAARGLDIDRISHVVNYELPGNVETYVHRIGRTGRAGRLGVAISFVSLREKYFIHNVERVTKRPFERMELPSVKEVNNRRIVNFKQKITDTIANEDITFFEALITEYQEETQASVTAIAAGLAKLLHNESNFLLKQEKQNAVNNDAQRDGYSRKMSANLETYRIEVGKEHGVQVGDILHVIESIAKIDRQYVGQITLRSKFSLIDLPGGMTKEVFQLLKKAELYDKKLKIEKIEPSKTYSKKPPAKSRDGYSAGFNSSSDSGRRKYDDSKPKRNFSRKKEAAY